MVLLRSSILNRQAIDMTPPGADLLGNCFAVSGISRTPRDRGLSFLGARRACRKSVSTNSGFRLGRLVRTAIHVARFIDRCWGQVRRSLGGSNIKGKPLVEPVLSLNKSRPTWAEISLKHLRDNFRSIRRYVGPRVTLCAVIKADAYRHGLIECAKALQKEGAHWFGVTSTEEGVQLRQAGIKGHILLMAGFWLGDEDDIVVQGLTPAVWERWHLDLLEVAAKKRGNSVNVHLKVDTGMSRLGVLSTEMPNMIKCLRSCRHLSMDGMFTHLASAEAIAAPEVRTQIELFRDIVAQARHAGLSPKHLHVANSAAIVSAWDSWNNMVRPGISIYGYYPRFTGGVQPATPVVVPVLSWKTRVISVRHIAAGHAVGYNRMHVVNRASRIAVLPVGYADGLNRQLSSLGRVIIRESYAPILGRISMDLTLVDITEIPEANIGDEVILIGTDGGRTISASDHANAASTIPYEILCNISKRVPRRYFEN